MTFFFFFASSMSSGLMPDPIVAIAFLNPNFSRLRTSLRPSTMMIPSESLTFGPAVMPWNSTSVSRVRTAATSSMMFLDSSAPACIISISSIFARSMIVSRFAEYMFSIFCTRIIALHGPILSIVSSAAPITAVLTWSRDEVRMISPLTRPLWLLRFTSTCPMRPVRSNFRNCNSSPSRPSVCPKIAPMTSLRATVPSALIVA